MKIFYLLIILSIMGGSIYGKGKIKVNEEMAGRNIQVKANSVNRQRDAAISQIKSALSQTPAEKYADSFYYSANRYLLDWRVLATISRLESSFFRFDSCWNNGKANGFGIASNKVCYKNYPEAIEAAARLLATNKVYTSEANLVKKMCIWNIGRAVECEYGKMALAYIKSYE